MKDMPSGGSSGHIDAPAPEGSAPSNANEIGNEPDQDLRSRWHTKRT